MGDEDYARIQLNVRGTDVPGQVSFRQPKQKPRSWSDRKARKRQRIDTRAASFATAPAGLHEPQSGNAEDSQLKGYELPARGVIRAFNSMPPPPKQPGSKKQPAKTGGVLTGRTNQRMTPREKIGRLRLASRNAGDRELTPDQDDILGGSDDEIGDVNDVVALVTTRDEAYKAEMTAQGKEVEDHGEDDADEVVTFGWTGSAYPPIPRDLKERNKVRRERNRASAQPTVAPGQLTHAGADTCLLTNRKVEKHGTTLNNFQDLGLSEELSAHAAALGFATPTDVQAATIPHLLNREDVLVNAPTGSGKTLAYILPILQNLASQSPRTCRADGTAALILAPTRELCLQVADVLTLFTRRFVWIIPGAVYGGDNRNKEKARLRKGVTVLVATPGRLLDHLEKTTAFRVNGLRWLVLDEADRLLDLGFGKKIEQILGILNDRAVQPNQLCSALLSATLHNNVRDLATMSLRCPVSIGFTTGILKLSSTEDAGNPSPFEIPKQLKQRFCVVPMKLRLVVLAAVLKTRVLAAPEHAKLVVFFSTCDGVDFHHAIFGDAWTRATGAAILPKNTPLLKLHGEMPQAERTATLLSFTRATAGVLLCTDVAARGLDFPSVTSIIQFNPAGPSEEYVHRVGRTARLGHSGEALLFLLPAETGYVAYLQGRGVVLSEERVYGALDKAFPLTSEKVSLKTRKEEPYRRSKDANAGGDAGLAMLERHQGAFHVQQAILNGVAHDPALRCLAEDGFRAYVRAYATHGVDIKAFFSVRSLHLGHVAHSFGLRERPKAVGQSTSKALVRKRAQQSGASGHKGRKIPSMAKSKPAPRFGGYVLS